MNQRLLFVAVFLTVPFFLTGCGLKKKPQVATSPSPAVSALPTSTTNLNSSGDTTNYLGIDPTSLESAIRANSDLAQGKAKLWKNDAVLYHVSVKFPVNLEIGQVVETFTYGSPSDAYNWWTMTISGKTGKAVRALIPKEDYLGTSLKPVPTKFWKTNYVEALQLAESSGGADFRSSHPETEVTANLMVSQPKDYLWWVIEYTSATSEPFRILVNPATKEVSSETGEALTTQNKSPVTPTQPIASPSLQPDTFPASQGFIDESTNNVNDGTALEE